MIGHETDLLSQYSRGPGQEDPPEGTTLIEIQILGRMQARAPQRSALDDETDFASSKVNVIQAIRQYRL